MAPQDQDYITCCYRLIVSAPNSYVETLPPVPLNVTVFGDKVFKEVIQAVKIG